jgi:Abortive infection C-terminus
MRKNVRVHSADFFEDDVGAAIEIHGGARSVPVLNVELLDRLRSGPLPDEPDLSAAEGLFDLVEHELIAYGTSGSDLTDQQSILLIRTLEAVTRRLGIPINLPFRSFSSFRSYWIRRGASGGGWDARRVIIADLFDPARKRLENLASNVGPELDEHLIANLRDPAAIRENLKRLQGIVETDPPLAIGTAKELVESTAKTVLLQLKREVNNKADVPALVHQAQEALWLAPHAGSGPDRTQEVRRILGGLMNITTGIAELRNRGYGTGHGSGGERVGLRPRHARLAVNAAMTWCSLILDTLADPEAPWRTEADRAQPAPDEL